MTSDGPLQDMAADLGLTCEALYRTLAALEADARDLAPGAGPRRSESLRKRRRMIVIMRLFAVPQYERDREPNRRSFAMPISMKAGLAAAIVVATTLYASAQMMSGSQDVTAGMNLKTRVFPQEVEA